MQISQRANSIKPSATVSVSAKANELHAKGIDVINLSVGEPDFDTPDSIKEAAIQAIKDGHTKYTDVDGTPALKDAVIQKFKTENNLDYARDQVIVSCGAKQSIYNVTQAVLNSGDEVIIPAPYWVSYPAMALLADAVPVIVQTSLDHRFVLTAEELEKAMTPKTKLLILNSPSNPTGVTYKADELKALANVLLKHPDVWIVSDDMYEHILWGVHPYLNIVNVCPALKDRTVVCNGVSKSFAMTGWRIGYAAGPKDVVTAMRKIQSHSTSNPTSISQDAAVAALTREKNFLKKIKIIFKERHDFLYNKLIAISGVDCPPGDGAFYLFPNVEKAIARQHLKDDVALCELILEKAHVAVVPGTAFGTPKHIRISYAMNTDTLDAAVQRIAPYIWG